MFRLIGISILIVILFWQSPVQAGVLSDRVTQFPNWDNKPPVTVAEGDLFYPRWMAGEWIVTSTLVEMVAPLAPEIVTPGFESNRQYLNQPIQFRVRFNSVDQISSNSINSPFPQRLTTSEQSTSDSFIIADREYNGLNIAQAILGDGAVWSVKVDPDNPNRQITFLSGENQLISQVKSRGSELLSPDHFVATEVMQQIFRGVSSIYLNEVETTTDYTAKFNLKVPNKKAILIQANQITAIYLSPQDPNYFQALDHPVSLYQYQLELKPVEGMKG